MMTNQVQVQKCLWCDKQLPEGRTLRICEECKEGTQKELSKLISTDSSNFIHS